MFGLKSSGRLIGKNCRLLIGDHSIISVSDFETEIQYWSLTETENNCGLRFRDQVHTSVSVRDRNWFPVSNLKPSDACRFHFERELLQPFSSIFNSIHFVLLQLNSRYAFSPCSVIFLSLLLPVDWSPAPSPVHTGQFLAGNPKLLSPATDWSADRCVLVQGQPKASSVTRDRNLISVSVWDRNYPLVSKNATLCSPTIQSQLETEDKYGL